MQRFATRRHRVAIAGVVKDQVTGKPVPGVRVEIANGPQAYNAWLARQQPPRTAGKPLPPRVDITCTRPDGLFFFQDLPAGDYGLFLFLPRPGRYERLARAADCKPEEAFRLYGDKRYGTVEDRVSVSYDEEKAFGRVRAIRLPPTAVRGKVFSAATKDALLMAQVRMRGSGECAFTDAEGLYTITGIEPGKLERVLEVRARGHRDDTVKVRVEQPGLLQMLENLELTTSRG